MCIDIFSCVVSYISANCCYNSTEPCIDLKLNKERTTLKCYMADTGLLISHAFDERGIVSDEPTISQIIFATTLTYMNAIPYLVCPPKLATSKIIIQCNVGWFSLFLYSDYNVTSLH
ncbi:hypothetical protein [uncultured Bacteroides sp.]|uniref:hypothetical protein n=1 Tax=uncultured Bacteroides sp. TaxID=162156 RepID=UPI002AA85757|nr:hypothetical protein [uncultured Bacteroides sp.]